MSAFVCSICSAEFCGPLAEASDAAFGHSGVHADPVGKTPAREAVQAIEPTRPGDPVFPLKNRQIFEQAVSR